MSREIEIGRILAGRYRIDRLRGAGGLGAVYEATDLTTDQVVAIKVLLDLEATPKDQARFLQEAELAARVKHPNVVTPRAFVAPNEKSNEPAFIVMELIADGVPLHRHIESSAPLHADEAIDVAKQVLSALAAAHRLGVVHRDVKPANVLLRIDKETNTRKALLVDFGIATMMGDRARVRTTTGVMLGTPGWAAPEQVRAEREIDARADVYAVGGCLYNMLTGKRAFTANDMVRQLAGHPPPRVSTLMPVGLGAQDALDDVVAKALEADPNKRFASAGAMLAALESLRSPASRGASPSGRFARTLIATTGVGALGIGVALLWSSRLATRPATPLPSSSSLPSMRYEPPEMVPAGDASVGEVGDALVDAPPTSRAAAPPARCVCNGEKISFCDRPMPSQCSCVRDESALCVKVDPVDRERCRGQLVLGTPGATCVGFRRYRSHTYEREPVEGRYEGCSRCYSAVESRRTYRGKNGDPCAGYDEDGRKQSGELSCLRDEER